MMIFFAMFHSCLVVMPLSPMSLLKSAILSMALLTLSIHLNEIAAALNDDSSIATSLTNLIDANETHVDNMATLTGVAKDETGLSTFTGSTISDGATIKEALQDLETAVEGAQAGSAVADRTKTETGSANATHYLTFVADDNASATAETVFTDTGVTYNPSSNLLTVGTANATTLQLVVLL